MSRLVTIGLVFVACVFTVQAQTSPDVIVGDLIDIDNYGSSGGIYAFAVGTESCNIGNQNLTWNQNTNQHPVIAQNMYRLKDGRFEQIGMSWLKHGFYALSLTLCSNCPVGSDGTSLNVGCSDPYVASLNGSQGNGPRSEVNAATGYFPYPYGNSYPAPAATIGRRIQVASADLIAAQNPGALYFVEGHYVHPEDAAAGNKNNNASYRQVVVNPATNFVQFAPGSATQQTKPAIQAWKDFDPTVQIHNIDIPGDGRVIVAFKGTPGQNGLYHYEYAVQNLNSDRSIGSFTVELWPGANPTNIGFHDVDHHSGDVFATTNWTNVYSPGSLFPGNLTWSTQSHAVNPNANALRWGSMFNFWFDCDQLPGNVTLGLFKPGTPTTMSVPAFCPPRRPPPGVPAPYNLVTGAAYDYVNITATGSPGPFGDDAAFQVPIGFSFPFFGQNYTQVVISTNGYLTLPGQSGTAHTNTTLPDAGSPNGIIAGYWDDLNCPNVGNVRYQTVGTAPNQRFVVYWNAVHAGDTQPVQFELILEPSGTIVSTIVTCPLSAGATTLGGATATRGIESWDNATGLLFSHNTPNSALNNTTIRYEVNNGVPITSNLFHAGSLGGGFFKIVYVSENNSPILTLASVDGTPTDVSPYGVIPLNIFQAIGLLDYFGVYTGFPNPGAITNNTCGSVEATVWVSPGSIPSGATVFMGGIDFPTPATNTANGWFHIAPKATATSP